jgi:glutamine synthetase
MPKPMYQQAGSGMHLHLFLTKRGRNAFHRAGEYGNVNELGRFFIGGMLKHGPALAAFTNPSTNSYKRLVPGFEAPVALTYAMGNRASAVRIPSYVVNPQETRFEYRPPDATANPYLCLTAMLLAGIDGVLRKIDPRKEGFGPFDRNIATDEDRGVQFLPRNLDEALDALVRDRDFLMRGGLFTEGLIDQWVAVKRRETKSIATMPHPYEYEMYFNL